MTQFINYDGLGQKVMLYHTVPSAAGTAAFEHKEMVALSSIVNGHRYVGGVAQDTPDVLVATCPVLGCGTVVQVPLTGDEEAQRLHARTRAARQAIGLPQAAQSVIDDVTARGGTPRITPQTA